MGYVWMALIGVAAFVALWRAGIARSLWSFAGAALMLGAAGYAWQGRPTTPGQPVPANAEPIVVDPAMTALRDQMIGHYTGDTAYIVASDAMIRAGDLGSATAVVLGGIRKYPDSLALWTALGMTMAQHDGDEVSPPALFAFQQAMRLSPDHPAPRFFLGTAYIKAGQYREGRVWWTRALAVTPQGAPYRAELAGRLEVLDQLLAMAAAQGMPAPR
jgi:cytochrome c-type biogenesis protein CcmH